MRKCQKLFVKMLFVQQSFSLCLWEGVRERECREDDKLKSAVVA
jgi:hypothetical protein